MGKEETEEKEVEVEEERKQSWEKERQADCRIISQDHDAYIIRMPLLFWE